MNIILPIPDQAAPKVRNVLERLSPEELSERFLSFVVGLEDYKAWQQQRYSPETRRLVKEAMESGSSNATKEDFLKTCQTISQSIEDAGNH